MYGYYDIAKDDEGDLLGVMHFKYNNDIHEHEFIFNSKEQRLISIDYGWKIPYIEEVWKEIEDYLKEYSKKVKN